MSAARVWTSSGEAIRRARDRRGWTQLELADEIGVSRPQIANIERGFSLPSVQTIEEVAETLRVRFVCSSRGWKLVGGGDPE